MAVDLKTDAEITGYQKSVNFENALASVSFKAGDCEVKRELFVSRADKIAVMRI